jgi:hypothetical protein
MDLLDRIAEQLAETDVPPEPGGPGFVGGVHRRLNPRILGLQVLEMATVIPLWAAWHLLPALAATLRLTLTGRWPAGRRRELGGID